MSEVVLRPFQYVYVSFGFSAFLHPQAEMRSKSTGTLAEEAVAEAKPIVMDFARKWKMSIEVLHKVSSFGPLPTAPACSEEDRAAS
jgi:hypothetical protein